MKRIVILVLTGFCFFLFVQSANSACANLAWNPNTEGDLAGYKVYVTVVSGDYIGVIPIDVGNVTEIQVEVLGLDHYYFTLTAYDSGSNESGKSNEANLLITEPNQGCYDSLTPTGLKIINISMVGPMVIVASWHTDMRHGFSQSWSLLWPNSNPSVN